MGKIYNNKEGSVIVGVMLTIFILAVSSTFLTLSITGQRALVWDYDLLNTTVLGEVSASRVATYAPSLLHGFISEVNIPPLKLKINKSGNSFFSRTYVLEGRATKHFSQTSLETGHIEAKSSVTVMNSGRDSGGASIYKTTKNIPRADLVSGLRRDTYAGYFWLTNDDDSENGIDDPVWWWGDDLVEGRVHTNTRISIKNVSSHDEANNDGWPLFLDPVTQVGEEINWHSTQGPMDDIFRGYPVGFAGEQAEIEFLATAKLIRQNGSTPFSGLDENDIAWIRFRQGAATSMIGAVNTRIDSFKIYACYPWPGNGHATPTIIYNAAGDGLQITNNYNPEEQEVFIDTFLVNNQYRTWHRLQGGVGPRVGVNSFTIKDTIWSNGPTVSGTVMIEQETWVDGQVSGVYTIGSAQDIYLIDDITYLNTPVNSAEDALTADPVDNESDILGLVSEKKIKIRYGYCDPDPSAVPRKNKPNSEDIVIYAAMCALGQGESSDDTKHMGIFTYDYQDPQPSDEYWHRWYPDTDSTYVEDYPSDIHLFVYPPTDELPWPSVPDYDVNKLFEGVPDEARNAIFQQLGDLVAGGPGQRVLSYPGVPTPNGIDLPFRNPLWPENRGNLDFERGRIIVWGGIHTTRRGYVHRSGGDPNNHTPNADWDLEQAYWGQGSLANGYDKHYHYDNRFRYVSPPNYPEANLKGGNRVGSSAIFAIQKQ